MANHHFGNYGDIWKHLLLAQILIEEQPDHVLESHAGAACYEMVEAAEREHGVSHFLRSLAADEELAASHFAKLLATLPQQEGRLTHYPGSPYLELLVCGQRGTRFLFCDVDEESISSLREAVERLSLPAEIAQCVHDDGIIRIAAALDALEDLQRLGTLVVIDPFRLLEKNEVGMSALDLFLMAGASGAIGMLWYAFGGSGPTQAQARQAVADGLEHIGMERDEVWWAELQRVQPAPPATEERDCWEDLLPGCGIVVTGLGQVAQQSCTRLTAALASIYAAADVPGGDCGILRLHRLRS